MRIELSRPQAPPKIVPPHPHRRLPDDETEIVIDPVFEYQRLGAGLDEGAAGNEDQAADNYDDQKNQRREAMDTAGKQNAKEQEQGYSGGNPTATRESDGDASAHNKGGITEEDFGEVLDATDEGVGQSQRQEHFEEATEVIRGNVGAGAAMVVRLEKTPDFV